MEDEADLAAADKRFAENLRAARERAGLSQRQLAEEMVAAGFRFRQQTIARIEAADRVVSFGESRALARACRTTAEALARPGEMARDGWLIIDAARRLREAGNEMSLAQRHREVALADLERVIKRVEDAGHGETLADEIAIGRRAMADGPGVIL